MGKVAEFYQGVKSKVLSARSWLKQKLRSPFEGFLVLGQVAELHRRQGSTGGLNDHASLVVTIAEALKKERGELIRLVERKSEWWKGNLNGGKEI